MALQQFPNSSKQVKLSDGTTYAYVSIAATSPSKPTFFLLHGFPSSCYDWRNQIQSLSSSGFGVIAPDLLGYGDTDKPTSPSAYSFKEMSKHMTEILDQEGLDKVIGVGHDWGCGLLSKFVNFHKSRLSGVIFVSVSYQKPRGAFDLGAFNAMTEQYFGYPIFGYWTFHNEDEAASLIEANHESFTSLFYPSDPEIWKTRMCPLGAAKEWVSSNTKTALPSWLPESEAEIHNQILLKGGYTGPLNWYKFTVRGLGVDEEKYIPKENLVLDIPTLFVVSDLDPVTRADVAKQSAEEGKTEGFLPKVEMKMVEGCGHWIQLEKPAEFSKILEDFGAGIPK